MAVAFRALLFCTTAAWLLMELRQGINERPEAVPGAAIRPKAVADWVGLGIVWCGVGLRVLELPHIGPVLHVLG